MARSTYIYVVFGVTGYLLGTFTVKCELLYKLRDYPLRPGWTVKRYLDGQMLHGIDITKQIQKELLEITPRPLEEGQ